MYGAIILAAGKGTRFHGDKQNIVFHGKPLWRYPLDLLIDIIPRSNIVVVGKDIEGGQTRSGSVFNGLKALDNTTERVIILEAARPLVTMEQIKLLLESKESSISFVMPLVNTVVYRDGNYIDRNKLYDLLVPQAFDCKLLKKAYETGKYSDMTDETRVMYEEYGIKPCFVETDQNLFKVTYPRDIAILESIYEQMQMRSNNEKN